MTDVQVSCNVAGCECGTSRRALHGRAALREDMQRDPGYLDENVISITALDKANLDALLAELPRTQHEHGLYGWRGCTSCRHLYAEAVAERFPPSGPVTFIPFVDDKS